VTNLWSAKTRIGPDHFQARCRRRQLNLALVFGRLFVKRFALSYWTVQSCLSCLSVTLVYCGQTVGWIKMKLGMQLGLGSGRIVLDGDAAPPPPKGAQPQWLDRLRCHLVWRPTEVGLSPGDIALDGDPALPQKRGHSPPIFDPRLLWPNGWMDQDSTWYRGRPQPRRLCVKWGPCPPLKRGPHFRHMSIVAKWLDSSGYHLVHR